MSEIKTTLEMSWPFIIIGVVLGIAIGGYVIIAQGLWERGKLHGAQNRISVQQEMNLRSCAEILQINDNLHPSQMAACGRTIETLFEEDR